MQKLGLQALDPTPRPRPAAQDAKIYPSLLGAVAITRPNQVWSAAIPSVRMAQGVMELVAILDWCRRDVLAWPRSTTLEAALCREALDMALGQGCPEMFNTAQGGPFTSLAFTSRLERVGSAISMEGRGRALDKIFVARLWRTVKYEDSSLKEYGTVPVLEAGLERSFTCYNDERPHQSLAERTPAEVHGEP